MFLVPKIIIPFLKQETFKKLYGSHRKQIGRTGGGLYLYLKQVNGFKIQLRLFLNLHIVLSVTKFLVQKMKQN